MTVGAMTDGADIWLVLAPCPRCGGTGYIEACYACFDCDGAGLTWTPIGDDGAADVDDEQDEP